ncbi:MAG: PilZ domain-containing protein [Oligoflexia bacterium]|nr:PilZ domain-containing protein [Oligoflexia bacterium]
MTHLNFNRSKRQIHRLQRKSHHNWSLRIGDDALITRNITNLSPAGLAFKAPEWSEFKMGQQIKVQLYLNKDENFECEAKIVWVKQAEERTGSLNALGLEFSKLPTHVDTAIMKLVNDDALEGRRLNFSKEFSEKFLITKKFDFRSAFSKIMGALMIASLTAALMAALYLHKHNNPEESLAFKLTNAFNKRLIAIDSSSK